MNDFLEGPCIFCGYNSSGYWQEATHSENARGFYRKRARAKNQTSKGNRKACSGKQTLGCYEKGLLNVTYEKHLFLIWRDTLVNPCN